jgi:hypothetical protein
MKTIALALVTLAFGTAIAAGPATTAEAGGHVSPNRDTTWCPAC